MRVLVRRGRGELPCRVTSLPCSLLLPFFRVSKLTITSHRTPHTPYRAHDAGAPATTVLNNRQALKSQVAPTDGGVIPIKAHLKSSQMGGAALFTPETHFHTCEAPLGRLVCARALRRASCVGAIDAHTAPPSHTESIESAQVLSSMVPREHSCTFGGNTCDSLCLPSRLWVCPRAYFHSRAPPPTRCRSASLLSTPARFTARDCLILRPRAGLPLSRD